jgi:hypothetical protein
VTKPRQQEKAFAIDKYVVAAAFKEAKTNGGAPGIDKQSISNFEKDLKSNLYVNGHLNLHAHGHLSCTVTDTSFARVKTSLEERVAPSFHLGLMLEGHHPLA